MDVVTLRGRIDSGRRTVLLDVRWALGDPHGRDHYRKGHIPGAVFVDLATELAGPAEPRRGRHPLPPLEQFQASVRRWGVRGGDVVVAYDDSGNMSAARLWWMLRNAGFSTVHLLDGGLAAWRAAGFELESGEPGGHAVPPGDAGLSGGAMPMIDAGRRQRAHHGQPGRGRPLPPAGGTAGTLLPAGGAARSPHRRVLRFRGDCGPRNRGAGHRRIPGRAVSGLVLRMVQQPRQRRRDRRGTVRRGQRRRGLVAAAPRWPATVTEPTGTGISCFSRWPPDAAGPGSVPLYPRVPVYGHNGDMSAVETLAPALADGIEELPGRCPGAPRKGGHRAPAMCGSFVPRTGFGGEHGHNWKKEKRACLRI
jgi:rhodanese-related sulfurtransferase